MVEVWVTWDLAPGVGQEAYGESAKKMIGAFLKAPGFVELCANRNLMGSPRARATCVWRNLSDWGAFADTAEYSAAWDELRNFITDVKVDVWGPSPVVPQPLRPGQ